MKNVDDEFNARPILVYGQRPPPFHGSNIMMENFIEAAKKIGYKNQISDKRLSYYIWEIGRFRTVKILRIIKNNLNFLIKILFYRPKRIIIFFPTSPWGILTDSPIIFLSRLFHIPYVLYLHTQIRIDLSNESRLASRIALGIFRSAQACIVLSEAFQSYLLPFVECPIYVLPNTLRENILINSTNEPDQKPSLFKILYLANISEKKGIWTLLEAIPRIANSGFKVIFNIGGPWQSDLLKSRALEYVEANHISRVVNFLGYINREKKIELFSNNDLFVLPSEEEAFPIVLLEAMNAGIPSIATNVGAIPEIIVDGKTGFLISPGDI